MNEESTPIPTPVEPIEPAVGNTTPECDATAGTDEAIPTSDPGIDIDALIAEAEQRGYLRGRNEVIAENMQQPALWENLRRHAHPQATEQPAQPDDLANTFLSRMRPGVWD